MERAAGDGRAGAADWNYSCGIRGAADQSGFAGDGTASGTGAGLPGCGDPAGDDVIFLLRHPAAPSCALVALRTPVSHIRAKTAYEGRKMRVALAPKRKWMILTCKHDGHSFPYGTGADCILGLYQKKYNI